MLNEIVFASSTKPTLIAVMTSEAIAIIWEFRCHHRDGLLWILFGAMMQCNLRALQLFLQFSYVWFAICIAAIIIPEVLTNSLPSWCPKATSRQYFAIATVMGADNRSECCYQIMLPPTQY
jgi:hypothetical protein